MKKAINLLLILTFGVFTNTNAQIAARINPASNQSINTPIEMPINTPVEATTNAQKLAALKTPENFLVSNTLIKKYTIADLKKKWKATHKPEFIVPVNFAVNVYEIIYKAPSLDKKSWINCSGICYVPTTNGKPTPTLMYGHGTEIRKNREINDEDPQQGICMLMATDGYLTLFPDYYGMGKGDGNHIYQHSWSEAMSFIYMLYAVEELKPQYGIRSNGQLFLTGYSQGGHAAFAAQKYLDELEDPRFKVTASVPMSGAYDMAGVQSQDMYRKYPHPFYLPYLITSYQTAYKIMGTENVYSIFKAPYDTLLPRIFGNKRELGFTEVDKLLPEVPSSIIRDSFVNAYKNEANFPFKVRLEENGLTNWKPQAPTLLCGCGGDREVHFDNSILAFNNMKKLGVTAIKLDNLSNKLDHNTCAAFTVLTMKYFFDRFKKNGKNPKLKGIPPLKKFLIGFIKRAEERKYAKNKEDKAFK